jgi:hypothetical protein
MYGLKCMKPRNKQLQFLTTVFTLVHSYMEVFNLGRCQRAWKGSWPRLVRGNFRRAYCATAASYVQYITIPLSIYAIR